MYNYTDLPRTCRSIILCVLSAESSSTANIYFAASEADTLRIIKVAGRSIVKRSREEKLDEILILVSVRYPMYSSAPSLLIKKSTSFNGSLPEIEKFQRRYTMGVFSRTLKGLSTSTVMVTSLAASVNKNIYKCSVKERLKYV